MQEIFKQIPDRIKEQAKYWVDLALKQKNPYDAAAMVAEYANSCFNEEEKDFVDFYFNLRLEELLNENNND